MYKIKDMQIDRYFADGEIFKTKEEVRQQLISYHSADCNEASLKRMSFNEILEFGEWDVVKICPKCKKEMLTDDETSKRFFVCNNCFITMNNNEQIIHDSGLTIKPKN